MVKGYAQRQGKDYDEIFPPVARIETIRIILAISVQFGWLVYHLDVKTAFLNGEISEDIYVQQLEGYVVAYDPRRHQGMTLWRRRSPHPRASSPLDRRRRRMPSFTTPSEDLISPRHISQGSCARVELSFQSFISL